MILPKNRVVEMECREWLEMNVILFDVGMEGWGWEYTLFLFVAALK